MKIFTNTIFAFAILFLSGCDEGYPSTSGIVNEFSYSVYWDKKKGNISNLYLLILSDFTDENSSAKGQRLFGGSNKPISGYHDRDGEVVTFAVTDFGSLLILDQYIPVKQSPVVVHLFRDKNGILDVKILGTDSEIFKEVFSQIKAHNRN